MDLNKIRSCCEEMRGYVVPKWQERSEVLMNVINQEIDEDINEIHVLQLSYREIRNLITCIQLSEFEWGSMEEDEIYEKLCKTIGYVRK